MNDSKKNINNGTEIYNWKGTFQLEMKKSGYNFQLLFSLLGPN